MAKQSTRSSGAAKTRSSRSTGTRTTSRGAARKAAPPPTTGERVAAFGRKALGGHGHDIAGLALVALGIIAALGI
ncbi:MAG: hypothetical protein KDB10_11720, partial [Acidimicrobiales bacterium]|nr:hypothetical protein [Acidimicrobiales bacterium]